VFDVWKRAASSPVIDSNWIRKQRDTKSPRSSESGRFPGTYRKSRRLRSKFRRSWNAIELPEKIASSLKSICLKSRLWTAYWIAFSSMDRLQPPSCNPHPCRRARPRFHRRLLAVVRNVSEIAIVFGEADPSRACPTIGLRSRRNGQYVRPALSRYHFW